MSKTFSEELFIEEECEEAIREYKSTNKPFTFYFNECKITVDESSTVDSLMNYYYHNVDFDKYFR